MQIQVSGIRNAGEIPRPDFFDELVEAALANVGLFVESVTLHLDEPSARAGADAAGCRIEVRVRGGDRVLASATGVDAEAAARRAVRRVNKLLRRRSRRRVAMRRAGLGEGVLAVSGGGV